ncbi:deah-box rna helicase [Ophiostoma piceae UAMH 11346]|uniref:RNA helicase n=1 Tax=Ophiostoma piceae (strain UAMH 11346) TaxID=1262450 RepID=S3C7X2_OPHP1|nr:deah-box rna helicase [Ophiostoma piceae UAMH 11346]
MPPAKKFVPRQRKHKVRARLAREANEAAEKTGVLGDVPNDYPGMPAANSNSDMIIPEEQRERNEKKAKLRAELRANQASQMSAKKAKRLEKYIETKLRKDESRELNDRLGAKAMDIAIFESSKDLGKGKKRRRAEKAKKDSMEKPLGDDTDMESDNDSSSDDEAVAAPVPISKKAAKAAKAAQNAAAKNEAKPAVEEAEPTPAPAAHAPASAPAQTGSSLFGNFTMAAGSGLKRPLELGDDGRPVLKKRAKRGGVKSKYEVETVHEKPSMVVIKPPPFSNFDESDEDESESDDEDMNDLTAGQIAKFKKDVEKDDSEDEDEEDVDDDEDEAEDDDDDKQEEEDSDSESEEEEEEEEEESTTRKSAFKDWATKMRNEALGHQPSADAEGGVFYDMPTIENFEPRAVEQEPLPASLQPTTRLDRKAFHVDVQRPAEIEETRVNLPVVAEEQQIIEAIHEHDVVVISGGTGSGKTTQVPQFLYEAGFGNRNSENPGMIGVTQPRRVAAVSMARRVAEELGPEHGRAVAYQIRYESNVSSETAIKFMTDGVLLREVSQDIVLSKYSVIIIDEAHERSINTDVLIGVASRVNTMRKEVNRMREEELEGSSTVTTYTPMKPLKIIVMSATLQVTEFTQNPKLFLEPPRVIDIEGRQYPVTVHFAQKTRHDYVEEAFRKIVRGHRKLPPGGFLVFLTGEDEIQRLAKRLRLEINGVHSAAGPKVRLPTNEVPYEAEDIEFGGGLEDEQGGDAAFLEGEEDIDPDNDDFDEEDDETEFVPDEGETVGSGPQGVHVLPLFSKLPTKEQQRVFQPAPENMRQVILATNVAETSLTIPGIRYVFDCGRAKARTFNRQTGVQSFEIDWVSKASSNQRSGRAGRTGPGHCYRLYSSAVYEENFAEFADPEILRMPIEGVVLQLKALGTPHIDVFPFPTPPDRERLIKAEGVLTYLSALHPRKDTKSGPVISEFGRLMSVFPLSPRFAKILMVGHPADCIHYVIALVAAMSTEEIFVRPNNAFPPPSATSAEVADNSDDEDDRGRKPKPIRTPEDIRQDELRRQTIELFKKVHRQFASLDDKSDALKLLQVIGEFSHEPTEAWCKGHFVHFKALREVQKMRRQITNLLRTSMPVHAASNLSYQEQLPRPSDDQIRLLKQMLAAGFVDNVAIRADLLPTAPEYVSRKPRRAIEVPYKPLFPIGSGGSGGSHAKDPNDELTFIHPSSVMAHLTVAECPPYVIFSHLQRSQPSAGAAVAADDDSGKPVSQPKVRMRALTDVTGLQLSSLLQGTSLLRYGKPIKEVWRSDTGREREVFVIPELKPDTGATSQGWPLPAAKVRQVKDASIRGGWTVVPRPKK